MKERLTIRDKDTKRPVTDIAAAVDRIREYIRTEHPRKKISNVVIRVGESDGVYYVIY